MGEGVITIVYVTSFSSILCCSNSECFTQPWWLGGRAVAAHSVVSAVFYLGGFESHLSMVYRSFSSRNWRSTPISTRPRATKQGRVKCRCHVPFQRSQHREQSQRRADTTKTNKKNRECCIFQPALGVGSTQMLVEIYNKWELVLKEWEHPFYWIRCPF